MPAAEDLLSLIPRLRAGDTDAQREFCRHFEPHIRRAVRVRLRLHDRLRRVLDSVDVCQEVLNSFLRRTSAGEYDLREVQQLYALLEKMSTNKLSKQRRRFSTQGRALDRQQSFEGDDHPALADGTPSVSRVLASQELLAEIMKRLPEEERRLAVLRADGLTWPEIAQRVGGQPDALRMRLARALHLIVGELDLLD